MIVDLRELTFIDSSGLHLLIGADTRARLSGRRLVLVRGRPQVDRLFELVGISDRLDIVDAGDLESGPPQALSSSPPGAG